MFDREGKEKIGKMRQEDRGSGEGNEVSKVVDICRLFS
jgi:hypothetical protein